MTKSHPFEFYGPAPYRIVKVEERVHVVPGMFARAGSTCDVCGACIRWCYTVRAGNGAEFTVGCDCARKAGMSAAEIREANRGYRRERAEREAAVSRREREAAEREANRSAFGIAATDREIREGSAAGRAAARQWLEAERLVEARYVGEVGKRLRGLELRCDAGFHFDGHFGTTHIWILRDRAGNAYVWKTSASLGYDDPSDHCWKPATTRDRDGVRKSGWFVCDATVKAHAVYRGLRQTELARVKIRSLGTLAPVRETRFLRAG